MKSLLTVCFAIYMQFGFAQWSNTTSPLLTTGNASIEKDEPYLILNNTENGYGGLIFKYNGSNKMFNFYDVSENEVYWSEQPNFGTANALSLDLDLNNMSPFGKGFLQMGFKNGAHLDFDANEIQARNGSDSRALYINYRGGDVSLGIDGVYFDDSQDFVGIGTSEPKEKLHVDGNIEAGSKITLNSYNPNIVLTDPLGQPIGQFGSTSSTEGIDFYSQNKIFFHSGGNYFNPEMVIDATGNIGVGNKFPDYKLDVKGSGNFTGELTASSDARFKENISSLDDALKVINTLNPVSYDFKSTEFPDMNFSEERRYGLIAQEVEKILPTLVSKKGEEEYRSLNYIDLIPFLIKALQEEHAYIEILRTQMLKQEIKLEEIRKELETTKSK